MIKDKLFLGIDIGNTKIALGVFKGAELIERWRIATATKQTAEEYAILLDGLFRLHTFIPREEIKNVMIASVVPHLTETMVTSVKEICPAAEVKILTSKLNLGMKNLYLNPDEVGADRLANAVGGKLCFGKPLIIVDFGTATTIDVVDKEGDYLGGVILPGLEMSADALFAGTARLPRIPLSIPETIIGKTTVASIQSGICIGSVASVDSLIERIWEELGYKTEVVATGGYATMLASISRTIKIVEPYLTLYGLKHIWELNTTD